MSDNQEVLAGGDETSMPGGHLQRRLPFRISAETLPHFFSATSHRQLVRSITLVNESWRGADEHLRLRISAETPLGVQLIHERWLEIPAFGPGDATRLSPNVQPDLGGLASLNEAVRGYVLVELISDDEVIGLARNNIEFLAYDQWIWDLNFFESYAAFILPRHPFVLETITRVRDRLKEGTGSSSTEGYQSGPDRVLQIIQAIWDELLTFNIAYSDPPASFEGYGQKIRTPDSIARERAATCLDSAALLGSLMAAAGLSPLLIVVKGHAFPACWLYAESQGMRRELNLPHVIDNVNIAQFLYANQLIAPLESTVLTSSGGSFDEALRIGAARCANFANDFEAMIDIERAVLAGVRTVPIRTGDGTVAIVSQPLPPPSPRVEAPSPDIAGAGTSPDRLAVPETPLRVRRWLDALLDISRSNSLINLKSLEIGAETPRAAKGIRLPQIPELLAPLENAVMAGKEVRLVVPTKLAGRLLEEPTPTRVVAHFESTSSIPISDPAQLVAFLDSQAAALHASEGVGLIAAKHGILAGVDDALTKTTDKVFKALKKAADDLEQQSASNQLFLCIGTLVWQEPAQGGRNNPEPLRSPLYIVPVRIKGNAKTGYVLTIDEGGEITPNYCLMEKLRAELDLRIPELEQPVLDDSGIDVDRAISAIRLQLGQGNHKDITVEASATLAVLDFASFRTWRDLRDNWRTFMRNEVVRHLVETPFQSFEDTPQQIDGELLCPIACDESQLEAVRWAAEGRSFVLEGPPGTGKSQTIANLIAASMALGKRILFVAEKQVALEVVSRRLATVGLDPFCIVIHHESVTPDGIRQQLRKSLDFEGFDRGDEWDTTQATLESIARQLQHYRDRVVDTNAVGHSLWTAQQELIRKGESTRLQIPAEVIDVLGPHHRRIQESLLALPSTVGANRVPAEHPWAVSNLSTLDHLDLGALDACIRSLHQSIESAGPVCDIIEPILSSEAARHELSSLQDALRHAHGITATDLQALHAAADPAWLAEILSVIAAAHGVNEEHADVVSYFIPAAYTMDLLPQMTAAVEAMNAGIFSKRKKAITLASLMAPITLRTEEDPSVVVGLLQRRQLVAEQLTSLRAAASAFTAAPIPSNWNPFDPAHLEAWLKAAEQVAGRASSLFDPRVVPVRELIEQGGTVTAEDAESIGRVASSWNELSSTLKVSNQSIQRWRKDRSLLDAISESLAAWTTDSPGFIQLQRWVRIVALLEPLRSGGLDELADRIISGSEALDGLGDEYLKARALASRTERLRTTGLEQFDRQGQAAHIDRLVQSDREHKELMRDVIPRRLVERRPFKPRLRYGHVGRLEAELGRKVRRISLPKLIREYGETVTHLTPCFLMSPDAVARLLPADSQFFDIVVFDEASQIKVANAIPAMGRAKSVIVVGDSQQMPPSVRIGTRSALTSEAIEDGDSEEVAYADLESILSECRESNIPHLMLKCHFRSRHEGLISFSNQHFYENNLVTFPAPNSDISTPITWHQIDGHFVRSTEGGWTRDDLRTNEAEAIAIVADVQRRLRDPLSSGRSIGIVTLNEQQRTKIINKLNDLGDPLVDSALQDPDPERRLFVNALEQVQGDERDVIMMSIAFSYQGAATTGAASRKIPLQFGPIVNQGGERRLNVAVTRAKEELVVFCSFNPDDMDLRNSSSVGLERMKQFLQMARDTAAVQGAAAKSREASERDFYRKSLLEQLRAAGVAVREELGLSKFRIDLAVSTSSGSDQFLAILLDGPSWASRSTVYDRDVLPDSVLRGVGWRRIGRIWLPGYIAEPDHVLTSVLAELDRESRRVQLRRQLEERQFEIREDSQLAALGVDFAIRRCGAREWALAICLAAPGVFPQAMPYIGRTPPDGMICKVGVHRATAVWLPDLEAEPEQVLRQIADDLDRVEREIAMTPIGSASRPDQGRTETSPTPAPSPAPSSPHSQRAIPFVAAEFGRLGDERMLASENSRDANVVAQAIREVLAVESPIEERRLASLVAARFGLMRLREARFALLKERHFFGLATSDHGFGVFVWRDSVHAATWTGYRVNTDKASRDIELVAPEEVANAAVEIVEMSHTIFESELVRELATTFGRKQVTGQLRGRLTSILNWATTNHRLQTETDANGTVTYTFPGSPA